LAVVATMRFAVIVSAETAVMTAGVLFANPAGVISMPG
jgi:hypothetical protein